MLKSSFHSPPVSSFYYPKLHCRRNLRALQSLRTLKIHFPAPNSLRMNHTFTPAAAVLPRLPVPDLRKTITKYLDSLRPFLLEDAKGASSSYEEAFALREKWADEFVSGIGGVCQDRLKELDRNSPDNWLDDNFWLKSYLQWRAPLLINSNWWLVFNDDALHPSYPSEGRTSHSDYDHAHHDFSGGYTDWQVRRAAWLAYRTLEFKDKIHMQELHPVTTRTGVWIQESVSNMFNRARIPQPTCDVLSPISPLSDPLARNITVIVDDWFYSLCAYDIVTDTDAGTSPNTSTSTSPGETEDEKEKDGSNPSSSSGSGLKLVNPQTLHSRLKAIVHDAVGRTKRNGPAPQIGVLSADERDTWASNLEHLLSIDPQNRETHESIVKSLICLCLDKETHVSITPPSSSSLPLPQPSTISQLTLDSHLHSIRSVPSNVSNRFFDKPSSLIVDPSGRAGAMGEHSPCDALVPSIVGEYAVVEHVDMDVYSDEGLDADEGKAKDEDEDDRGWKRLDWVVDEVVEEATMKARERAEGVIRNSDDSMLWFEEYGSDWIKSVGFSSDAYIQMAMQLAWYRTTGTFTATYETALTRMFNKGRTETIRTLSVESRAFVLAMVNDTTSPETKHHLLQRAVQKHTSLTRDAATGRGIDRHLLGLRSMLRPGEQSELFDDPLFAKSQEWRLSTSGLSAGHHFRGTGFGSGYENGYGINYLAAPSMIKFGIETKFSGTETSTEIFKGAIYTALRDMKDVILHVPDTKISHDPLSISRLSRL
ncbi:acyltransferase ChoActase/COT/CPT [Lentinula raphanica]|nr:acyltransferase ChoActase/COT/CPT [Lentinula raphanica]